MSELPAELARSPISVFHAYPGRVRTKTAVKSNGEPERWVLAARLSRVSKKDRERGDALIDGIQTQDQRGAEWARDEGHVIVHVTKDRNISGAVPPWERPELGLWLTDPTKLVLYDGLVAYDVDRLSRDHETSAGCGSGPSGIERSSISSRIGSAGRTSAMVCSGGL